MREIAGLPEMQQVADLFVSIWGGARPPATIDLMSALSKAGNYVAGAFDGTALVGACIGFFHAPAEAALHSHIAGVRADAAGRGVGQALKMHQRDWALARGVTEVTWTFDPLIGRNAYFNLAKLGARAVEYLPDFYGPMGDDINGTDASDRLLVRWNLREPEAAEKAAGAVVALGRDATGRPVPGTRDGDRLLIAVPTDVHLLRATDPGLAREWRSQVSETMTGLLAEGARVTGFDRDGGYVMTRPEQHGQHGQHGQHEQFEREGSDV
ncbi:hypothetical protein Kisp02_59510 [Kineosporia sp. NBRC 101731]|nr:hypothetical protein Kisp02_59510 [Kineosporia sp. NBRC 101731]